MKHTSWLFEHRLRQAGLLGSMGRIAASVDSALIESFWSGMQRELIARIDQAYLDIHLPHQQWRVIVSPPTKRVAILVPACSP